MSKRLFIGIGVQAPKGMDALPGVHDAIRRIGRYAEQNSDYDTPILFLDDKKNNPVTAERINKNLTANLLVGRPRIVVYFCGHGAFLNGQEIWYLSNGKAQWSQRVLVPTFRDILQTYGPQQISFFSDACQTAEFGIGDGSPILDAYEGEAAVPKLDIFRATIRGQPAYATPVDGPLFSKVIAEVLVATPPESALDRQYLRIGERVVSSQSLATYVEEHLPDTAAMNAGRKQNTEIASGFRYDTNDYLKLPQLPKISADALPSDRLAISTVGGAIKTTPPHEFKPRTDPDIRLNHALDASLSEWRQNFWHRMDNLLARQTKRPNLVITIAEVSDIVKVAETVALATPQDSTWQLEISLADAAILISIDHYDAAFKDGAPFAALLSVGGLYVPLELQKDPETVVLNVSLGQPAPRGVGALGWNGRDSHYQLGSEYRPMEVLKGLMTGELTADLVQPLAARLRSLKHKDPLYGIAAAYLYDRIGDINGIRRMCLFYAERNQGVPFDIALLSQLKFNLENDKPGFAIDVPDIPEDDDADRDCFPHFAWQAMSGRRALRVASFTPVLQAGWTRLATLNPHPLFKEYLGLRDHLTNAPFATFESDAAYDDLLALFKVAGSRYEMEVSA